MSHENGNWPVTFIAAILTVMGHSSNDTIVIIDRVRENLKATPVESASELAALVNRSIMQTWRRSVYTVLMVLVGALSLYELGAEPLQMFSLAIFLGLACGAYSSIFIAAPIWERLKVLNVRRAEVAASSHSSRLSLEADQGRPAD